MKYCENCGNKLEEGFAFCNKCGAKVEVKEHKKHEEKIEEDKKEKKEKIEKEEKVEKIEKPVHHEHPPVPSYPPKRPGRGKIVFLSILSIILLATTVTFLILWVTKSCDSNCGSSSNYNGKDNTEIDEPKEPTKTDSKYVGKWEQNVEYKTGTKVTKRTYGMIELKKDGTFESIFYDKDNKASTTEEVGGTYKVSGNKVSFEWKENGIKDSLELTIKNDKICIDSSCENYLVKNGNSKITIYNDDDDDDYSKSSIKTITYSEYEKLQIDYKDAIVVIVREGCSWCEKFKPIVEQIASEYTTPVYYYQNDGKISISGTPTTIIIKNGYVVGSVEGYKELSDMEETLDNLGVR